MIWNCVMFMSLITDNTATWFLQLWISVICLHKAVLFQLFLTCGHAKASQLKSKLWIKNSTRCNFFFFFWECLQKDDIFSLFCFAVMVLVKPACCYSLMNLSECKIDYGVHAWYHLAVKEFIFWSWVVHQMWPRPPGAYSQEHSSCFFHGKSL